MKRNLSKLNYTSRMMSRTANISLLLGQIAGANRSISSEDLKNFRLRNLHSLLAVNEISIPKEVLEFIFGTDYENRPIHNFNFLKDIHKLGGMRPDLFQNDITNIKCAADSFFGLDLESFEGKFREHRIYMFEREGIFNPSKIRIPGLLDILHAHLINCSRINLAKACWFLFEMEFIQPFPEFNRLISWGLFLQLVHKFSFNLASLPILESFHTGIEKYEEILRQSLRKDDPSEFIHYVLNILYQNLVSFHSGV